MKQTWEKLLLKFDALTQKDRVLFLLLLVSGLVGIAYLIWIEPISIKKKLLIDQNKAEQLKIVGIKAEVEQKIALRAADPDIADKARLEKIKSDKAHLLETLREKQKGLVASDQMAKLVEDIVRKYRNLNLKAFKTLPVTILNEAKKEKVSGQISEKEKAYIENAIGRKLEGMDQKNSLVQEELPIKEVYKYGVELTIEGNYLDMIKYMEEVESMPWQLFWGEAALRVDAYPKSTLTLTLFTLSLDKRWLYL